MIVTLTRDDQVIAQKTLNVKLGRGYLPWAIVAIRWIRSLDDCKPLREYDQISYQAKEN